MGCIESKDLLRTLRIVCPSIQRDKLRYTKENYQRILISGYSEVSQIVTRVLRLKNTLGTLGQEVHSNDTQCTTPHHYPLKLSEVISSIELMAGRIK